MSIAKRFVFLHEIRSKTDSNCLLDNCDNSNLLMPQISAQQLIQFVKLYSGRLFEGGHYFDGGHLFEGALMLLL